MQQVWLIRHGTTEWSLSGQHTGRTDLPLLDVGRKEALSLHDRVSKHKFALTLTSPLSRARDTAALCGLSDAIIDDDLMEWNYGDYEGRTTADIHIDRPDWFIWNDGAPNGEQPADVAARCDRVLARIAVTDGDVAVVAHGHLLRVLTARWLGQTADAGRFYKLDAATLSILSFERTVRVIALWNDRHHAD